MPVDDEKIEDEVTRVGGRLEWISDVGIGISFPPRTTDDVLSQLRQSIRYAVWISLEDTMVTDSTLLRLERAPVLEAIDLAGTFVTVAGIRKLLKSTPTIRELTVSESRIDVTELGRMRKTWPKIDIVAAYS